MGTVANITVGTSQVFLAPAGTASPNFTGHATDFGNAFSSPGFTQDGIEWDYTPTWKDIMVDELMGIAKKILVSHKLVVSAKLAEATLQNLAHAIPGATFDGANGLTIGTVAAPPEFVLGWIGPAPSGKQRECVVYRVVSIASVKAHYQRKSEVIYQVQFEALSDSAQVNPLQDLATFKDF